MSKNFVKKIMSKIFFSKMGRLFSSAITIPSSHIFYESRLSFAFVNLKPVLPGHVLVAPKRHW